MKMLRKIPKIGFAAVITWGAISLGQGGQVPGAFDPGKADLRVLNSDGQLVSIQLTKRNPLRFLVVGNDAAHVDFKNMRLIVRQITPDSEQIFEATKNGDEYTLDEPIDFATPTDLEVTAKMPERSEVHFFRSSSLVARDKIL